MVFFFDDLPTIINYAHARVLDIRGHIFQNPRWISRIINQYTFIKWGQNPFPYRLFNLFIHLLIGVLVFVLVYRLLSRLKKTEFLRKNSFLISCVTSMLFLLQNSTIALMKTVSQLNPVS